MSVIDRERNETTYHDASDMNITEAEDVEIMDDEVFGEDENVSEIESQRKEDTENGPMEVPTELDKNLDSDEVFAEDVSGENRKRKQQEDIETVSPEKKRLKNPSTTQPKRSTRSASEKIPKIPKAKETAGRANRGKIEENCIVCVGEEAAYDGATRKMVMFGFLCVTNLLKSWKTER